MVLFNQSKRKEVPDEKGNFKKEFFTNKYFFFYEFIILAKSIKEIIRDEIGKGLKE